MKQAIVTLCIGNKYQDLAEVTHPTFQQYAHKTHSDFIVINQRKLDDSFAIHFEKLQIYYLLEKYDRLLFIDTDAIFTPSCPNLFEIVAEEEVGAYLVSKHTEKHVQDMQNIKNSLGKINWEEDYFNSGVMVVSKQHREIFNPSNPLLSPWNECVKNANQSFLDQTYLNYMVHRFGMKIHDIGYKFNHTTAPPNSHKRFESYVIHYPGMKGHRRGNKVEQIKKDLFFLNNKNANKLVKFVPQINRILDLVV